MATPPRETPHQQAVRFGQALASLRGKVTQAAAAEAYGMTRQGWGNYESGDRLSILRSDMQDRLTAAIGRTRQDLLDEAERMLAPSSERAKPSWQQKPAQGLAEQQVSFELPVWTRARAGARAPLVHDLGEPDSVADFGWMFGPETGILRVAGDSMTGYVESGQLVVFDRNRWPRRGEGCVIETSTGEVYVKEFLKQDGGTLYVTQRFSEETIEFPMAEVKGVYWIRLRGD